MPDVVAYLSEVISLGIVLMERVDLTNMGGGHESKIS